MDEVKALPQAPPLRVVFQDRLLPAIVAVYLAVMVLAAAALPVFGFSWLQGPFVGALMGPNLVFSDIGPTVPQNWEAHNQGVAGALLAAVGDQPVNYAADVQAALAGFSAGDRVLLHTETAGGQTAAVEIVLQDLPASDRMAYFYMPYLVGLVYLGAAVWVFIQRRDDAVGRAFAIFSSSAGFMLAGFFDLYTTQRLIHLWTIAAAFAGGALLHLALVFPRPRRLMGQFDIFRLVGYAGALFFIVNSWPNLVNPANPFSYIVSWRLQFIFLAVMVLLFTVSMGVRWMRSPSPIEQEQARVVLWGIFLGFGSFALWGVGQMLGISLADHVPPIVVLLPIAILPALFGFVILRYRLMNTDQVISRAVMYAALTILAGTGYALLVSGMSLIFGDMVHLEAPFFIGGMAFLIALGFNPLRIRLQKVVDEMFFRGEGIHRQELQAFTSALTQAVALDQIIDEMRQHLERSFQPVRMHVFIFNPLTDFYMAVEGEDGRPTTDIRFPLNSGLVHMLIHMQTSIFLNESDPFPKGLRMEKPRIALLGAQLFLALPGKDHLAGWLALGPRSSGEVYTNQDLNYLTSLAEQAALAIERAQVLEDKDRRVHELNVLSRVAQGVNVTLDFNDILELLYAQTRQVIDADDFSITLYTAETDTLRHVFYLENDERLEDKEGKFISPRQGLEREVISSRRYLLTEEYGRECRNRQMDVDREGVFAWLGVPLNAGAEIIGVISVGSRNPAVLYGQEQYSILQAISDQAAGAIVKARLLDETERRAKQLASLNEMARGLTSTLDIEPLLNSITYSAVEILNCEAGSLLLVDEETDEYVFEVVTGPAAGDLLGKRIAPGVGLVGKAVVTKSPIIVNDTQKDKSWFEKTDEKTGFSTQRMLVVPMIYKERVIGVLEVLNKKDGMPFNPDDQELLTAFSGQAAVAMENARLYTLTDQKLASRVEELSVMQRIDRELNASLDVERAMQITMEWSMRQSEANAGLIGILEEIGLRVMASEGYSAELDAFEDLPLPLYLPAMLETVDSGVAKVLASEDISESTVLLTNARSQIVIPIRRETDVIGLLMLESREENKYQEDNLAFLTRLSDHAAIAISNAQLYAEVQRANIAKSDFVSFVSHELKTPMTSIKGYAELLSAGAVGEVTDAQSEFLHTIRNNITRMATLVSDLADVSRIEAGRLHLEFAGVNVGETVEEVVRSAKAMIEEKNLNVQQDIPEDLPEIWGDRNRLVQVLTNLMSNAYKYTLEDGTVTIRAREAENIWDEEGAPQVIHLQVIDSGIGIKEEDQAKIFTQYFRTDEGKDTAPGTGLGLNITRNLVEMQGGRIWFESTYGEGTTFQFTVPVAEGGEG